jgi:hypothetical protein
MRSAMLNKSSHTLADSISILLRAFPRDTWLNLLVEPQIGVEDVPDAELPTYLFLEIV